MHPAGGIGLPCLIYTESYIEQVVSAIPVCLHLVKGVSKERSVSSGEEMAATR